ncbi:MAG: hypothetical protein P4L22_01425 [Candidatus Babeliales bacterium]|nr:hypothetical protein [Candidatus Babeliales bacterium]
MNIFSKAIFILCSLLLINSNAAELPPEKRSQIEKKIIYHLKNLEFKKKQSICCHITQVLVSKDETACEYYKQLTERKAQLEKVSDTLSRLSEHGTQEEYIEYHTVKKEIIGVVNGLNINLKGYLPEDQTKEKLDEFIIKHIRSINDQDIRRIDLIYFTNNEFVPLPNTFNKNCTSMEASEESVEKKIKQCREKITQEKKKFETWESENQINNGGDHSEYTQKYAQYQKLKLQLESQLTGLQQELKSIKEAKAS